MIYVLAPLGALVLIFVAFVVWRYTSVKRGTRQRDEKIAQHLDPIAEKLAKKEQVSSDEVSTLAEQPQMRPMTENKLLSQNPAVLKDNKLQKELDYQRPVVLAPCL